MEKVKKMVLKVAVIIVCVAAGLALFGITAWALFYYHESNPAKKKDYETDNVHITGRTMISAHRSGAGIVPEELLGAFKYCIETSGFTIDYFEFDLHLTKDGALVLLHDATLDRTSNSEEVFGEKDVRACDKTLAELKTLNMAAKFVNEKGEMPYADKDIDALGDDFRIATVEEVLDYLISQGDFKYIIEIKDKGDMGKRAVDKLYQILKERKLLEKVLICSFKDEVLAYVDEAYPDAARGAGYNETMEFAKAVFTNRKDYHPKFAAIQLPYRDTHEDKGINTGLVMIINYAHKHNIAVQYWTVNKEKEMKYLASVGADLIMSDYPDRLYEAIFDSKEKKK